MNLIKEFEKKQVAKLSENKNFPDFRPGDTIKVGVKIIEGKTERLQYFQGLCIGKERGGINSTFTVRKISNGEGVERKFPYYSPKIESIEIVKKGIVKRAKLYYMRELRGKAARIQEKKDFLETKKQETKTAKPKEKPAEQQPEVKAEAKKAEAKTETPAEAKKEETKETK